MEGFGGGKLLHGPLAEQFISVLVEAFFLPGLQGKELFRGESVGSILRGATKKQVVTRQIELPPAGDRWRRSKPPLSIRRR